MRRSARSGGLVALIVILALAAGFSLWPHALTNAAFGIDLRVPAAPASGPEAFVPIALVRIVGVVVALFATMILATWTKTAVARRGFVVIGGASVLLVSIQWTQILPFAVGLGGTVLTVALVVLGWLALAESEVAPAPSGV
jgi:hypothetical protein